MIIKPFRPYSHRSAITLSAIICLLLNFIFLLGLLYAKSNMSPPEEFRHANLPYSAILFGILSNFVISYLLYLANFKLLTLKNVKRGLRLSLIILGTLALTITLSYTLSRLQISLNLREVRNINRFVASNMGRDLFISIIVLFSSQLIYFWHKQQQTLLENQKLITENIRTRYEVLKNQVDPHFLFNSLNTLNSLIATDTEKAHEYVQQLSSVFRYTLQNKEIISLKDEMEFARSYWHLMKIRYGENLQVNINIDEKYYAYYIMPLSLQILVENAIKHNIISAKYPLLIHIETTDNDAIKVYNVIQPKKDNDKGEGIGLANLTERYKLLLQKEVIITNTNGVFNVEIPLINQIK